MAPRISKLPNLDAFCLLHDSVCTAPQPNGMKIHKQLPAGQKNQFPGATLPFSSVSHSMSRIGLNMLNTACSMHICSFNTSDAEFVHLAVSSLNTWEPMQATPAHEAKAAKAQRR